MSATTLPCPGDNCTVTAVYLDGDRVVGYERHVHGVGGCIRGRETADRVSFWGQPWAEGDRARLRAVCEQTLVEGGQRLSDWLPEVTYPPSSGFCLPAR